MATQGSAFAAHSPTGPIVPFRFDRRIPRADDVTIEILYCGVCHSDVHNARNDWGNAVYPMVPGHEIVGRVVAAGPETTRFKIGDRVGVGCFVDSCRYCAACRRHLKQYCENGRTDTYNSTDPHDGSPTHGVYSEMIVVSEAFVLKIPDNLDLASAAPLRCAGMTLYSPLHRWKDSPGQRVGIVGLGGLGRKGLKFAKAMDAEVTLFTRSPGKEDDARRLGADHIVLSSDKARMAEVAGTFDLIVDTVPTVHDLNPYVSSLTTHGALVLVGYLGPLEPALNSVPMVMRPVAIRLTDRRHRRNAGDARFLRRPRHRFG